MRLMMLGASLAQLPGILAARRLGHEVVTCDDRPDSIGHAHGTHHAHASTFDADAVLREARAFCVDGIMTMGTDQPVLTAAQVAERLGLPAFLDVETARRVTDKRDMKRRFAQLGIPTVPWTLVRRVDPFLAQKGEPAASPLPLEALAPPLVVKPVDSQGQRGIFLLQRHREVADHLEAVLAWSRADEVLVESHYPNDEVTVSGWVHEGTPHVLSITDRVTFRDPGRLGVCLSHELPSRHLAVHGRALCDMTRAIVEGFGIQDGPLYFQFLIGREGIRVNEVACRIGGAFESQFLPRVTGFDPTVAHLLGALGLPVPDAQWAALDAFDVFAPGPLLSVQLFFAEPGEIAFLPPLETVRACPGVLDVGYHVAVGHVVRPVGDATGRIGYCVVEAPDAQTLEARLEGVYAVLAVLDAEGRNLTVHRPLGQAWQGGRTWSNL